MCRAITGVGNQLPRWEVQTLITTRIIGRKRPIHIVTPGIDLAKDVFALRGADAAGKPVPVRPSVARAKRAEVVASLPSCLSGMEACTGAHWRGCSPGTSIAFA